MADLDPYWMLAARQAGLDFALREFPDDVTAAAEGAAQAADGIAAPSDPRDEPWPPMRVGPGL